ncbi:Cof subfamily of IIB subfamily of haloacid dehalogenase superfamily/HAD-superfamily hydrolase, subfamily IIB [Pelagirhabdus alkalitolerans]|uniref:Cof subfamily of IIB subfamily of haloacid dehalogenase superfamily/HAD-superfamily hydrolase, subfamily IIB n=1 Tax=Pelagirhabdus alkalitolerans TaxID=1612202 RepID=A0A1G6JU70_9BACI|nr:HAD family hydrolase [Pelagirhabdus alkalitolerans]SDC22247.1 Cof subfamily of IIB subfamily of haloacid dehalogenase superfamily/HAD-superfamily hydrolase, subfamily IIB [Pelagirhabdus alkalitolerans]
MKIPSAIVMDLDGTLLTDDKRIPKKTIDILKELKEQGILLIFATARPPRITRFENIQLHELGLIIYYNGALFNCPSTQQLIHYPVESDVVEQVVSHCLTLNPNADISLEVKDRWYSFKDLDYQDLMHIDFHPEVIDYENLISLDATKILVTDFSDKERLVKPFQDQLNIVVTDEDRLIQIASQKASKEQAVEHILNQHKLDFTDVACFGDDHNDIGLFEMCGYPIALKNSIDQLKLLAKDVTLSNNENGVGEVLQKWL